MNRRIALVCMTPEPDGDEPGRTILPSYGIRRIQAAVASDPDNPGHNVHLVDFSHPNVGAYVDEIIAFEPELVGFSIYVWSTPCLIAVAREVRRRRPGCVIVFGGPSARSALFDLRFYHDPRDYLDAIVEGDGESIFREIAGLADLSRASVRGVAGVASPAAIGWLKNPKRAGGLAPDMMPSPFQLGLMPPDAIAYLETYRGCPMACRFCEWGTTEQAKETFSADYIEREIQAFERLGSPAVYLLDAGLNLNIRAFRNLREAARRTGYLKKTEFLAEIYPSIIRDEHLEFLGEIGPAYLGVGMQSMDREVLRLHQRPFETPKFEQAVRDLASVTNIELQIIFGLPGDTPRGFLRTLDYALSLPAKVRAFHCLVLPDALMTRGLPGWNMVYDPRDLSMISCLGWSVNDIVTTRGELKRRARAMGGTLGQYWWSFPHEKGRGARTLAR